MASDVFTADKVAHYGDAGADPHPVASTPASLCSNSCSTTCRSPIPPTAASRSTAACSARAASIEVSGSPLPGLTVGAAGTWLDSEFIDVRDGNFGLRPNGAERQGSLYARYMLQGRAGFSVPAR